MMPSDVFTFLPSFYFFFFLQLKLSITVTLQCRNLHVTASLLVQDASFCFLEDFDVPFIKVDKEKKQRKNNISMEIKKKQNQQEYFEKLLRILLRWTTVICLCILSANYILGLILFKNKVFRVQFYFNNLISQNTQVYLHLERH